MVPFEIQNESKIEELLDPMTPRELRNRILHSHTQLRVGMGVIGVLFPPALWLGGLLLTGTNLQASMSAYYHTPMRDLFVGVLFTLGGFLYLYKGFSRKENYALNLGGMFAVGVAIFPMALPPGSEQSTFTAPIMHAICGILFFFCLAYVCLTRASDTLHLISSPWRAMVFNCTYKIIGVCFILLPLAAAGLASRHGHLLTTVEQPPVIFAIELAATWVFGVYWLLKSIEIHVTQADRTSLKRLNPK